MTVYTFTIPGYLPPRLNEMLRMHWARRSRLQKEADQFVGCYGRGVPKAAGRRRVSLTFHGGRADPDARLKIVLDALVHSRLLIDDSQEWCQIGEIRNAGRRGDKATVVTLEDIE